MESLTKKFAVEGRFSLYPQTPVYDPDKWDVRTLRCYGYALQNARLGDCVLGALPCCVEGALSDEWFSVPQLKKMAGWDGLLETDFYPGRSQGHIIALTYGLTAAYGGPDYHFYLYHPVEGFWSHKLGCSRPTNVDSEGALITDPRIAARGALKEFVGYFTLPPEGVLAFARVCGDAVSSESPARQQTLARPEKEGYTPPLCQHRL